MELHPVPVDSVQSHALPVLAIVTPWSQTVVRLISVRACKAAALAEKPARPPTRLVLVRVVAARLQLAIQGLTTAML